MTTFVTGATGFIGSAVVRALLARGMRVRALVRPASNRANIEGLGLEIVEGDLSDSAGLTAAMAGATAVFHVAADYRHWARNPAEIYRTNVDGTENVLRAAEACAVSRLVFTGSVGAMGIEGDGTPARETTPAPFDAIIGHYHRSKYLAAKRVEAAARDGLNATIVSPTMPLGPRDIRPTPTGRIIVEAASGRLPAYVDTGLNLVHVDDVAEGHVLAFERGARGENYILGGENMTLRDLLVLVGDLTGHQRAPARLPHAVAHAIAIASEAIAYATGLTPLASRDEVRLAGQRMYFSSARAMATLGYAPRPTREAVKDAIEWFERHGHVARRRRVPVRARDRVIEPSGARPASHPYNEL